MEIDPVWKGDDSEDGDRETIVTGDEGAASDTSDDGCEPDG